MKLKVILVIRSYITSILDLFVKYFSMQGLLPVDRGKRKEIWPERKHANGAFYRFIFIVI